MLDPSKPAPGHPEKPGILHSHHKSSRAPCLKTVYVKIKSFFGLIATTRFMSLAFRASREDYVDMSRCLFRSCESTGTCASVLRSSAWLVLQLSHVHVTVGSLTVGSHLGLKLPSLSIAKNVSKSRTEDVLCRSKCFQDIGGCVLNRCCMSSSSPTVLHDYLANKVPVFAVFSMRIMASDLGGPNSWSVSWRL